MFNNLRFVTASENQRNRTKAKNNTSGVQGVQKRKNSWEALWYDNEGLGHSKCFSIKQFGDDQAKALATVHRKTKELEFGYL